MRPHRQAGGWHGRPRDVFRALVGCSLLCSIGLLVGGSWHVDAPASVQTPSPTRPADPRPSGRTSADTPARPPPPRVPNAGPVCKPVPGGTSCAVKGSHFTVDFGRCRGKLNVESGMEVDSVDSIHHGIYKTVRKGVKFAFKTECRPAAKWHGQQGWPEIAAHHFSRALLGDNDTVPCAAGVVLQLSADQIKQLHTDRCGVVAGGGGKVAGVAMQWTTHRDDALTSPELRAAWKLFSVRQLRRLSASERRLAGQVSLVLAFDFLLHNPDREEKNWFWGSTSPRRLLTMDNGWAFIGSGYAGSVCDAGQEGYLTCPPLFRYTAKLKGREGATCRGGDLQWCVWDPWLVERLRGLSRVWPKGLSKAWREGLLADPLVGWLLATYNTWGTSAPGHKTPKGRTYSTALGRFTQGCPGSPPPASLASAAPADAGSLMEWMADGIGSRLDVLLSHIDGCIAKHGRDHVLQGG